MDIGYLNKHKTLAHRLRRWPNNEPALSQRLMFAGMAYVLILIRVARMYSIVFFEFMLVDHPHTILIITK